MARTTLDGGAGGSRIGQSTVIRGSIRGAGDIDLHGRVEGTIDVDGDVTVAESARLKAPVNGGRVVVRGAIAGNIRGKEAVILEEGARVVGDIAAPSIGIRAGGLLRGHVASGDQASQAHLPQAARSGRATATQRNMPVAAPGGAATPRGVPVAPPAPPRAPHQQAPARLIESMAAPTPEKKPDALTASLSSTSPHATSRLVEPIASPLTKPARSAPPPVMPALQKGVKAALKKKAR